MEGDTEYIYWSPDITGKARWVRRHEAFDQWCDNRANVNMQHAMGCIASYPGVFKLFAEMHNKRVPSHIKYTAAHAMCPPHIPPIHSNINIILQKIMTCDPIAWSYNGRHDLHSHYIDTCHTEVPRMLNPVIETTHINSGYVAVTRRRHSVTKRDHIFVSIDRFNPVVRVCKIVTQKRKRVTQHCDDPEVHSHQIRRT